MYKYLNEEQKERVRQRIEELDIMEISTQEEYDALLDYYAGEMLDGYLDEY